MKIFKKGWILEDCSKCGAHGLIDVTVIEIGKSRFKHLLCKECIKDVIANLCQREIKRTVQFLHKKV